MRTLIAIVMLGAVATAQSDLAEQIERIARIKNATERLAAYDSLAKGLGGSKAALETVRAQVEAILADVVKARAESLLTKSRTATAKAMKSLDIAMSLTAKLKVGKELLQMLIHNAKGTCQETLGRIAKHRRPQEVANIRALQQKRAILAYQRTIATKADDAEAGSARAYAMYRVAVLGEEVADFHEGILRSYEKFGRSYPLKHLIVKFRILSHRTRGLLAVLIKADDEKHGDRLMDEGHVQLVEELAKAREWATKDAEVLSALDGTEAMRMAREAIDIWSRFRKEAGLPGVSR